MPELLMATITYNGAVYDWTEAEPVAVELEGTTLHLTLDDGLDVALSAEELKRLLS